MKKISFDFDNTIAMSYMTYVDDQPTPVFQSYNDKIIKKIKKHIKNGDDIYIVTARTKELEPRFPDQNIEYHLARLGLKDYFWPDRVIYTAAAPKHEILSKLNVQEHYDDSIEEHFDAIDGKYKVIQPLNNYKDSNVVGKVVIFDKSGRLLILQRSDEGLLWDLPGGHIKNVEIARGDQGYEDGTDREIFEETGLLLPFLKEFMVYDFVHKGITHEIHLYLSEINSVTPNVRLDLQDHVENIDFRWVTMDNLELYMGRTTTNLRKAFDELAVKEQIFENNEPFQLAMKRNHWEKKKKMVGLGKNQHTGGGKGHSRPNYSRNKSAPVGFGVFEEEKSQKSKKKVKIKVKMEEKRKKRRKKRRKTRKKRGYGGYYPYYDLYDGGNTGDSGGNGGE